jgi:hypothetical protein
MKKKKQQKEEESKKIRIKKDLFQTALMTAVRNCCLNQKNLNKIK